METPLEPDNQPGRSGRPKTFTIGSDSAGSVRGEIKKQLEPTQQAGLLLAGGVGVVTTVTIVLIVSNWLVKSPSLGVPGLAQMSAEQAKTLTDNLKLLNDMAVDGAVKLFDTIVARSLLPVFTAILGYIFGTRAAANNGKGD